MCSFICSPFCDMFGFEERNRDNENRKRKVEK